MPVFLTLKTSINCFKKTDIFINVILPLLIGSVIYILVSKSLLPKPLSNHLADGVWAYSFQSCVLIIWERKINTGWTLAVILCALLYEFLQYIRILPGTGDMKDVFFYILFISLALISNRFFYQKIKINTKDYEQKNQN
jgi:hypothetical protein